LHECGIERQTSAPYTPQQNGVAERANRTIMECARSMIRAQGLFGRRICSITR
jgi:transposase InsO family protein